MLIAKIEKGMILDPDELIKIDDFLRGSRKLKTFMQDKQFLHLH